ncbi:MAG: serine/threonine-protein kinase [Lachnospiraceae bacterium]
MIYQETVYNEVSELGGKGNYRTVLLRGDAGQMMVCKQLTEELVPVYRKLKELPHPNLVKIYDLGIYDNVPAVYMEYYPAVSLAEKMIQLGSFSLETVKKIMLQVCAAVYCFHKEGIIHRDLAPSNILINPQGIIKITDFGIARFHKRGQTSDTVLLGTPGFAAPEQFGFAQTDDKTDIYSLGILMNWMCVGKLPVEELYQANREFCVLIQRCITMNAKERCQLQDIEKVVGGKIVHDAPLVKRIMVKVPGFRSGNKVHMTLATIEYAYMLLLFFSSFMLSLSVSGFFKSMAGLLLSTLGLGWFVGSFSTISYRTRMNTRGRKAILFIIYFIIGFVIVYWGIDVLMWKN